MANQTYYEMLGVPPTATSDEIEAAYMAKYNKWRRVAEVHPDPGEVAKASQALHALEQIRVTLMDPGRRAAYDAGTGLGGAVGGLADPAAVLRGSASFAVPSADGTETSGPAGPRLDAWVCPACQTPNRVDTRRCQKCGEVIGIDCPKCGHLNQATAVHCTDCGADIQQALKAKREEEDDKKRGALEAQIRDHEQKARELEDLRRKSWVRRPPEGIKLTAAVGVVQVFLVLLFMVSIYSVVPRWDIFELGCWVTYLGLFGVFYLVIGLINAVGVRPAVTREIQKHQEIISNLQQQIRQIGLDRKG